MLTNTKIISVKRLLVSRLLITWVLALVFTWGWSVKPASAQCTTCDQTRTTNAAPPTAPVTNRFCITTATTLTYNTNFDMNTGATLCVGTNVTFSATGGNHNGNWTINNYGTFSRNITLVAGQVFNNYGSFTGQITLDGGTFNHSGTNVNTSGFNFNSGNFTIAVGSSASFSGGGLTLNSGSVLSNFGTLSITGGGLTVNSGATANLAGTNITGGVDNNGTINILGQVRVNGQFRQNAGGTVVGSPSGTCNYLNVTGNIQGNGSYNGINGLLLSKDPGAPNGTGSLTNGATSTAPNTPGNQVGAATLVRSGNSIVGTITNPGGTPAATSYLVLRRAGAAVTDVPETYTNYLVGTVIGSSTVVANNPISTLTFTDVNVLTAGCNTYHYAVFAVSSSGGCGAYNTTLNVTNRSSFTFTTVGGSIAPATTTSCNGASPGALTLSGHTGSILRWESSTTAAFTTPVAIAHTNYIYTPGTQTTNIWYRSVLNAGTGCATTNSAASAVTLITVAVPLGTDNARCGNGVVPLRATATGTGQVIDWYTVPTGGTRILTGASIFTTPVLSTNTIYYAEARHVASGCLSPSRRAISALITAPATIVGGGGGAYCAGQNVTLSSSGTNLSNTYWLGPNSFFSRQASPVLTNVTATESGTYTVIGSNIAKANILSNGDFEAGNIGFYSAYAHSPTDLYPEGVYNVINNPQTYHASFSPCADHTPGAGTNMMVVNGSVTSGTIIWQDTVPVDPGQEYQFSYWETSVYSANPSEIQVYINGVAVGPIYEVSGTTCAWEQFYFNWPAGTATTALITLVNRNTQPSGNDFALDDMNFQQVCAARASVTVIVGSPAVPTGTGASRCNPGTVALSALVPAGILVDWYAAATGGIALATNSPTYTTSLTVTTTFYAQARNPNGDCLSATRIAVTGNINPIPTAPAAGNAERCGAGSVTLTATPSAGETIDWYDAPSSGTLLAGGLGTLSFNTPSVSTNTTYYAQARNIAGGCLAPMRVPVTAVVNAVGRWYGINNAWTNAANWCGGVPTLTSDVFIPAGAPIMPQVNGISSAGNLTIEAGATVSVLTGQTLNIGGTVTANGTFTFNTGSTINYASGSAQSIPALNYWNLSTSGTGNKTFSTTDTTRIRGTFTPAAGSHTTTGSTLHFNGTGGQNIPAFAFDNLVTSGNSTKSLTGNITVNGALTLKNGTMSINANTLTLNGSFNSTGTGTLSGNCTSNLQVGGSGSTGALRFTTGLATLGTLSMVKTTAGDVNLGNDLDICTQLTLTQGKIVLGTSNLTLLSSATSTNGNSTSWVVTTDQQSQTGAGYFIRQVPNTGVSTVFPIGTAGSYTPAYLSNNQATRNFRARAFNDVFDYGTSGGLHPAYTTMVRKTWEIMPVGTGGQPNITLNLQWNAADEGADFTLARQGDPASPYIARNPNSGSSAWVQLANSASQMAGSPYSLASNNMKTFSTFHVGSVIIPVPVTLGNLYVRNVDKMHRLTWNTYTEVDGAGFAILASDDGKRFEQIGYVASAGNSSQMRTYTYRRPSNGKRTYYKIQFKGLAPGDIAYSNIATATDFNIAPKLAVYPNPSPGKVYLTGLSMQQPGLVKVCVSNTQGQVFWRSLEPYGTGTAQLNIVDLPAGVYLIEQVENDAIMGRVRVTKL